MPSPERGPLDRAALKRYLQRALQRFRKEPVVGYMLAQITVRYGRVAEFAEIMAHMIPAVEAQGWTLVGGWQTRVGPLNEVWDLWDLHGGPGEIERGMTAARADPEFVTWAKRLPEVLESEQLRYLEGLPYSP